MKLKSQLKRLSDRNKNNKFYYYANGIARLLMPSALFRARLHAALGRTEQYDANYLRYRVNYYNKLEDSVTLPADTPRLSELKLGKKSTVYFFDAYESTRYFDPNLKAAFLFGDITHVPASPTIVKSRPIQADHRNSILLKLEKVRHFISTSDRKPFAAKRNLLVGRGGIHQPHRIRFFEKYFDHPLCDLGQTNRGGKNNHWIKPWLTIDEQLDYKFILCLEGNDVASNLKWVMSSNSLAVMPQPKFETWFMEETLIPNHHYVEIKDDYSDLEERLTYYIHHTDEALQIVKNANAYVRQFQDRKREELLSLLVLQKYFWRTGQLPAADESLQRAA